jgi:hypothetical protein
MKTITRRTTGALLAAVLLLSGLRATVRAEDETRAPTAAIRENGEFKIIQIAETELAAVDEDFVRDLQKTYPGCTFVFDGKSYAGDDFLALLREQGATPAKTLRVVPTGDRSNILKTVLLALLVVGAIAVLGLLIAGKKKPEDEPPPKAPEDENQ